MEVCNLFANLVYFMPYTAERDIDDAGSLHHSTAQRWDD